MPNLRLQNILEHKVNKICTKMGCQPSIGFIRLMLQEIFELSEIDIDESITDGSMDKGIDAVFEQENEDGENILYIVQSKYFQNPDKSLDEQTINKAILAISNYVLGDSPINNIKHKLKERLEIYKERLSNGKIDIVSLIFITNGQKINPNLRSALDEFKDQQNGQLKYEIYYEEDLSYIFSPISARPVKQIDLKIVKDVGGGAKTFINFPDIDFVQGKVTKIDVYDLAEIIKNNPNIFHSNVRAYQSIRNKVNEGIAKTLCDEEATKQFIYLNNGITFLCDDWEIKPGNERVFIDNPAIINGCQTASTILEVYNDGKIKPNTTFILARIIKSKDEEVKRKIIISSNTQTAIKNRDLISEDIIQKQLESQFLNLGYYYERKKGLHADKPQDKIIDLEKAAQYYLALYLQKPAEAKNKKSEIYKSYKEQIFNKNITAQQLLVGYILFNKISEKIKILRKSTKNESTKSILGNSLLHLLPLFRSWAIENSGKFLSDLEDDLTVINDLFNEKIDSIILKMKKAIKDISKKERDKFNPQYFFKGSDSLERILTRKESRKELIDKKTKNHLELNSNNFNRQKDLRYYKPDEYSFDGINYKRITYWNDLFVKLMELYDKNNQLTEGNVDFIDAGSRVLLLVNPEEAEKKLRKKLKCGLWLLTNFNSNYLSKFSFSIAQELGINLRIRLRPTRFRTQRKYKRSKKRKK